MAGQVSLAVVAVFCSVVSALPQMPPVTASAPQGLSQAVPQVNTSQGSAGWGLVAAEYNATANQSAADYPPQQMAHHHHHHGNNKDSDETLLTGLCTDDGCLVELIPENLYETTPNDMNSTIYKPDATTSPQPKV